MQLINVVNPSIYSPAWNPLSSSWLIASFQTSSLDESDSSSAISLPCQRWHWHWTCHVEKERIATNTFHTWLTWHKSYCFWSRLELEENFPGAFRHLLCINHSCCIKCLMRCDFDLFQGPQISCNKSHPLKSSDPLAKNNKTSPRPRKSWFSVSTKCCICSSAFSEYLPLSQSDNAKIPRGWWMPRCMKQRRLRQPGCRIPIMSPDLSGKQQCNCLWWKATKL